MTDYLVKGVTTIGWELLIDADTEQEAMYIARKEPIEAYLDSGVILDVDGEMEVRKLDD